MQHFKTLSEVLPTSFRSPEEPLPKPRGMASPRHLSRVLICCSVAAGRRQTDFMWFYAPCACTCLPIPAGLGELASTGDRSSERLRPNLDRADPGLTLAARATSSRLCGEDWAGGTLEHPSSAVSFILSQLLRIMRHNTQVGWGGYPTGRAAASTGI